MVKLPEYVKKFGYYFTVQVTPIGKPRLFGSSEVYNGEFEIYCADGGMFHWVVYAKRCDVNVEPKKHSVTVHGDGPYKWI